MKYIDVVAGVIFNDTRQQVLLALRKPEQHQGNRWEFPGGKLEANEPLQDGLGRELYEEIGITVTDCSARLTLEHTYPDKQVRLHVWNIWAFEGLPHGREGQQLRWVQLTELPTLAFPDANQPIIDGLLSVGA